MAKMKRGFNKCPTCNGTKGYTYSYCANCNKAKKQDTGFILSLISFIWLPCIPTIVGIAWGKAFIDMGMSGGLVAFFWIFLTVILVLVRLQELQHLMDCIDKKNF